MGSRRTFWSSQREPETTIGQFAVEMWTKVGIKTKLQSLERLTWINAVGGMNFQAMFSRFHRR